MTIGDCSGGVYRSGGVKEVTGRGRNALLLLLYE